MNKSKFFLFSLIIFSYILNLSHVNAVEDLSSIKYYSAKEKDTIETIARKFLPTHGKQYGDHIEDYIKDLKILNPQIKTWDRIPRRATIFLDILNPSNPTKFPVQTKVSEAPIAPVVPIPKVEVIVAPKLPEPVVIAKPVEPEIVIKPIEPVVAVKPVEAIKLSDTSDYDYSTKIFSMVTISKGNLVETTKAGDANWNSTQNSPISLGLGLNYPLKHNYHQMITASAYYSYMAPSHLEGDIAAGTTMVQPLPEIGINIYNQHPLAFNNFFVFEGLDLEKFSTLNTKYYILGADLQTFSNSIYYATVGIGKVFVINDLKVQFKLSISQSLVSQTTGPTSDKFSGERIFLFTNFRSTNKLSYHLFYKRHFLKGPTNLSIDRIGFGLGYDLF